MVGQRYRGSVYVQHGAQRYSDPKVLGLERREIHIGPRFRTRTKGDSAGAYLVVTDLRDYPPLVNKLRFRKVLIYPVQRNPPVHWPERFPPSYHRNSGLQIPYW